MSDLDLAAIRNVVAEAVAKAVSEAVDPLRRQMRALTLEVLRQRKPDDVHDAELLIAIDASVTGEDFRGDQLMAASVERGDRLHVLLEAKGLTNPWKLAKWLVSVEGKTIADLKLCRLNIRQENRVLWKIHRIAKVGPGPFKASQPIGADRASGTLAL